MAQFLPILSSTVSDITSYHIGTTWSWQQNRQPHIREYQATESDANLTSVHGPCNEYHRKLVRCNNAKFVIASSTGGCLRNNEFGIMTSPGFQWSPGRGCCWVTFCLWPVVILSYIHMMSFCLPAACDSHDCEQLCVTINATDHTCACFIGYTMVDSTCLGESNIINSLRPSDAYMRQ